MQSKDATVEEYMNNLVDDRKTPISKLRQVILDNLPKNLEETMSYGMIGYVIPKTVYPDGYHCKPELPLPFISIASQKNFVALYHMGMYAEPKLLDWFVGEYPKHCKRKLDMGKSCIRFKKTDEIPFALIGELIQKMSSEDWIKIYEDKFKK